MATNFEAYDIYTKLSLLQREIIKYLVNNDCYIGLHQEFATELGLNYRTQKGNFSNAVKTLQLLGLIEILQEGDTKKFRMSDKGLFMFAQK